MKYFNFYRYTLFYILYPVGVTGELICTYSAVKYANSHPEAWSYRLPNSWNFIFSYQILLITVMLSYIPCKFSKYVIIIYYWLIYYSFIYYSLIKFFFIPVFPQTYMHMIAQRRKNVGSDALKKAK